MGMRLAFTHRIFFRFDTLRNLPGITFRLLPLPENRSILSKGIDIKPAPSRLHRSTDAEGNPLLRADFSQEIPELQLTVDLLLDLTSPGDVDPFADLEAAERSFRTVKKSDPLLGHCVQGEVLPELISEWMDDISLPVTDPEFPRQCAHILGERIRMFLPLRPSIRSLDEIVADGKASASELALIMLAMLRRSGLPTRYVSGYSIDQEMHRAELRGWIEIFHPQPGWIGFDPARNRWTDDSYVSLSSCIHPSAALPFERDLIEDADFSDYYELKWLPSMGTEGVESRQLDRNIDRATEEVERRLRRSGLKILTASSFSFSSAGNDPERIVNSIRDQFLPGAKITSVENRYDIVPSDQEDCLSERGFVIRHQDDLLHIDTPFFMGVGDAAKKTSALFALAERERLTVAGHPHAVRIGSVSSEESPFTLRSDLLASWIAFWQSRPALVYLLRGDMPGPAAIAPLPGEVNPLWLQELTILATKTRKVAVSLEKLRALFREHLPDMRSSWITMRHLFCDVPAQTRGFITHESLLSPVTATEGHLQRLLLLSAFVLLLEETSDVALPSDDLFDRSLLPYFAVQELSDLLDMLNRHGIVLSMELFIPFIDRRFPLLGEMQFEEMLLSFREALEPVLHSGDSARMEIHVQGWRDNRYLILCNGHRLPMIPVQMRGQAVCGVRYHRNTALHFDIYDRWNHRAVSGCRFESGRFLPGVHSVAPSHGFIESTDLRYPATLDLRQDV